MKNVAAAFVFFTRLPLWRLKCFNVSAEYYKQVINFWPMVGWLTGGVMALTFVTADHFFPLNVAVILTILSRILLTGALHEDGLADFLDGFGGGREKSRILAIMKDSHIGTYGVLGLILYFLLFYQSIVSLPPSDIWIVLLVADPLCKFIASMINIPLSYARTQEDSKAKVVYQRPGAMTVSLAAVFGLIPFFILLPMVYWAAIVVPVVVLTFLIFLMKKKIGGYTGDCCGAAFLMCELSFYLGVIFICHQV